MDVIVIGATGLLGGQVVDRLLELGDTVTALVRQPDNASGLAKRGVRLVQGDLRDAASLHEALKPGFDGLITTAYGYGHRQKGDSLKSVDDIGNRNLITAARAAEVGRFVFTSILTAEKAVSVPHFHQKAKTERVLEASGLEWVALRPGGFLDTLLGLNADGIAKGKLNVPVDPEAPASTILSADVATFLASAVRLPGLARDRIDIGMDKPTNIHEICRLLSAELGRPIAHSRPPAVMMAFLRLYGHLFGGFMGDNLKAMQYVGSGQYVADTTRQAALFGPPPALEDSIRRWVAGWRAGS